MSIRVLFGTVIYILLGWVLCHVDQFESYTWYSGVWHGIFFVPNILKNLIWHEPYKATICTAGYQMAFWTFSLISILLCLGIKQYKVEDVEDKEDDAYLRKFNK